MSLLRPLSAATAALLLATPGAQAQVGGSLGFNVLFFQSFVSQHTETNGRLAVGGDATLPGYSVGVSLGAGDDGRYSLVVGGTLSVADRWQVFRGNVFAQALGPNGLAPTTPHGSTTVGGTVPVDFAAQQQHYQALSTRLAALPATAGASLTVDGNSWTFTGAAAGRNVFHVAAAAFNGACTVNINLPAGATAIINVSGDGVTTTPCGVFVNGGGANGDATTAMAGRVLWNYVDATSVQFRGSMLGSVLAPRAHVTQPWAQFVGDMVARSGAGNTEFYVRPFQGELPPPEAGPPATVTPEPATLALLATGLAGVAGAARRRRRP